MNDALVDSVMVSLHPVLKFNNLQRYRVLPVVVELVSRMRAFGYGDEVIQSILVPQQSPKP